MKFTKILRTTALAASLAAVLGLAAAPSAMADTATGNTQFTVKLSPVTLLYYYSQINLTLDSTAMLAVAGGSPAALAATALTATSGNVAGGAVNLSAGITPSATAGISAVGLDITNAWAVRSVTTPDQWQNHGDRGLQWRLDCDIEGCGGYRLDHRAQQPGNQRCAIHGYGPRRRAAWRHQDEHGSFQRQVCRHLWHGATIVITATST